MSVVKCQSAKIGHTTYMCLLKIDKYAPDISKDEPIVPPKRKSALLKLKNISINLKFISR